MGRGDGIFRSPDNGDTWRERNAGFAALDVNSVVINLIDHIFAGAAGGLFRSTNDADQWSDVSSELVPPAEMCRRWRLVQLPRMGFDYA
jgi:photosystem II stability/assembly factor-like uncharacterized protein